MKVIITGGTGFLGKALAANLSADQHEVIVLSRNPGENKGLPAGVKVIAWDGKSAKGWHQYAEGADAIVNLAGESIAGESLLKIRWTAARKERILQSRVNAGKAVTEAVQLAQRKPSVVVQASAVGFYGPRDARPVDETAASGNDFLSKVCQDWEAATAGVEAFGVRRVIIRTGVVLSKNEGALPMQSLPFKLFAGGPIGTGKQGYPWIHIRDEVKAIRFLIENPFAEGAFNLTAPQIVNNLQFSQALGRAMHRPSLLPTPTFVFKILFGEASTVLVDGQVVEPKRLIQAGFHFEFPEVGPALEDIFH